CTSSRRASRFRRTYSSSQRAPDGTAALLLPAVVQFFEKACRTSSRGRLFRFRYKPGIQASKQTALFHQLSGCRNDRGSVRFAGRDDERIIR
ncbi:hypothetical protein EHI47_39040, partial [Rhizobium leguminosarum]